MNDDDVTIEEATTCLIIEKRKEGVHSMQVSKWDADY